VTDTPTEQAVVDPTDQAAATVTDAVAAEVQTVAGFTVPAGLRDELHHLLSTLEDKVKAAFGGHNPAKVEQLLAHSQTVHMVIDDLHDTTPPPAAA